MCYIDIFDKVLDVSYYLLVQLINECCFVQKTPGANDAFKKIWSEKDDVIGTPVQVVNV